jgi:AcrR family transcriptional regulator
MAARNRDAKRTRAAILQAARLLLSQQDFASVSIRDIAAAAGVSHGLVQHHFGTKEQLVAAIIGTEVAEFSDQDWTPGAVSTADDRERAHREFRARMARSQDFARLITRAELAGVQPERMLDPQTPTPAQVLAAEIRAGQQRSDSPSALDADLVAAYVNAATFAFATLGPWLMASVGLDPDDYEARFEEITEISIRVIAMAAQVPLDDQA